MSCLRPLSGEHLLDSVLHDPHSGHLVGWSQSAIFVQKLLTNVVVTDRRVAKTLFEEPATGAEFVVEDVIAAAAGNHSTVAFAATAAPCCIPSSSDSRHEKRLFFLSGQSLSHVSPPLPSAAAGLQQDTSSFFLRLVGNGGDVVAVFGGESIGSHRLFSYAVGASIVSVPLPGPLKGVAAGPNNSIVVAHVEGGDVLVFKVDAGELIEIATFHSGCTNIAAVACSKQLIWILTQDGRMKALSGDFTNVRRDECTPLHQVTFYRRENVTSPLATFACAVDPTQRLHLCVTPADDTVNVCSTTPCDSSLALHITTTRVVPHGQAPVSFLLDSTVVQLPLGNVVGSVVVGVTSCMLSRSRVWDVAVLRQPTAAGSVVSAQRQVFPRAHLDIAEANVKSNGLASLAKKVTWSETSQLALLRTQCEHELEQLAQISASPSIVSCDAIRLSIDRVLALQHTALAFLKRECTESESLIPTENRFSSGLLRQIRDTYVRLMCQQFIQQRQADAASPAYVSLATTPLANVLDLSSCRSERRTRLSETRRNFLQTFQILDNAETPIELLQRWSTGHPAAEHRLSFDITVANTRGHVNPEQHSLLDCIGMYPNRISGDVLAEILFYTINCVDDIAQRPDAMDVARLLEAPPAMLPWCRVAYLTDHIRVTLSTSDALLLDPCGIPAIADRLPSLIDGLLCRDDALYAAASWCRRSLTVYAKGTLPRPVAAKALFVAVEANDAALVSLIARRIASTDGRLDGTQRIAVVALVLMAERNGSLMHLDGLYPATSPEFSLVEATLKEHASVEVQGSFVNAALLCQWNLATGRVQGALRVADNISRSASTVSAVSQATYTVKEHLRAHSISDGSDDKEIPTPSLNTSSRNTTELTDAELDQAVTLARNGAAEASRRTQSFVGLAARSVARSEPAVLTCVVRGAGGVSCGNLRPCPFHEAGM